jgi:hypothetical protein
MRNPRPCVCGHGAEWHRGAIPGSHCRLGVGGVDCNFCPAYRPARRSEPLRARTCGLSPYDCVLRHLDHADHLRPRRPTFTTTWPREPGPPSVKVIVRDEAGQVVAVCYGTTEGVTLPSDLASGERYTLQPIFQSAPEVSSSVPIHLRVAE